MHRASRCRVARALPYSMLVHASPASPGPVNRFLRPLPPAPVSHSLRPACTISCIDAPPTGDLSWAGAGCPRRQLALRRAYRPELAGTSASRRRVRVQRRRGPSDPPRVHGATASRRGIGSPARTCQDVFGDPLHPLARGTGVDHLPGARPGPWALPPAPASLGQEGAAAEASAT